MSNFCSVAASAKYADALPCWTVGHFLTQRVLGLLMPVNSVKGKSTEERRSVGSSGFETSADTFLLHCSMNKVVGYGTDDIFSLGSHCSLE